MPFDIFILGLATLAVIFILGNKAIEAYVFVNACGDDEEVGAKDASAT